MSILIHELRYIVYIMEYMKMGQNFLWITQAEFAVSMKGHIFKIPHFLPLAKPESSEPVLTEL